MITEQQEQEFKNINKNPCVNCGLFYCDCSAEEVEEAKRRQNLKKGYRILYSGSTWLGENPVKRDSNTLNKIIDLSRNYGGFEHFTRIKGIDEDPVLKQRFGFNGWHFWGNIKGFSCVFEVLIYEEETAREIIKELKKQGLM